MESGYRFNQKTDSIRIKVNIKYNISPTRLQPPQKKKGEGINE